MEPQPAGGAFDPRSGLEELESQRGHGGSGERSVVVVPRHSGGQPLHPICKADSKVTPPLKYPNATIEDSCTTVAQQTHEAGVSTSLAASHSQQRPPVVRG